MTSPIIRRYNI